MEFWSNSFFKEVDVGLAADVGILQRLEKITTNSSFSREIAFTAREFSATEALHIGFVESFKQIKFFFIF